MEREIRPRFPGLLVLKHDKCQVCKARTQEHRERMEGCTCLKSEGEQNNGEASYYNLYVGFLQGKPSILHTISFPLPHGSPQPFILESNLVCSQPTSSPSFDKVLRAETQSACVHMPSRF